MVLVVNIIFFSKLPKFRSNIFFIMNNTPGNAQRQGAEPRRASTLNVIFNPKPHFHCKHSNFWSAYRMRTIHMPKVNQKNRPFGLFGRYGVREKTHYFLVGLALRRFCVCFLVLLFFFVTGGFTTYCFFKFSTNASYDISPSASVNMVR